VPKVLLSVPHRSQQSDGDCLAACAAMVLAHLGYAIDYPQLLKLLKIKPYGAPAGNVRLLENLGLNVIYSKTGLAGLQAILQEEHPVIVFVRTGELPHWTYSTDRLARDATQILFTLPLLWAGRQAMSPLDK
jgi:ABC-type bacteriocin/lantibiotic exporter with double-glycine peptidase domain